MAEIDVLHPETPRDERLLPWRAFLVAHARITRRLDEELRVEHDLSLGEYDALLALAEATDRRLRMNSLADLGEKMGADPSSWSPQPPPP